MKTQKDYKQIYREIYKTMGTVTEKYLKYAPNVDERHLVNIMMDIDIRKRKGGNVEKELHELMQKQYQGIRDKLFETLTEKGKANIEKPIAAKEVETLFDMYE